MKDLIPLSIDTSKWKPGVRIRGNSVRKTALDTWLLKHDPCFIKNRKSRARLERNDMFRVFILVACQKCCELYIIDDFPLPMPSTQ